MVPETERAICPICSDLLQLTVSPDSHNLLLIAHVSEGPNQLSSTVFFSNNCQHHCAVLSRIHGTASPIQSGWFTTPMLRVPEFRHVGGSTAQIYRGDGNLFPGPRGDAWLHHPLACSDPKSWEPKSSRFPDCSCSSVGSGAVGCADGVLSRGLLCDCNSFLIPQQ